MRRALSLSLLVCSVHPSTPTPYVLLLHTPSLGNLELSAQDYILDVLPDDAAAEPLSS